MNRLVVLVVLMAGVAQAEDDETQVMQEAISAARLTTEELPEVTKCLQKSGQWSPEAARLIASVRVRKWAAGLVADCREEAQRQFQLNALILAQRNANDARKKRVADAAAYFEANRATVSIAYLSRERCMCQANLDEAMVAINHEKEKSKIAGVVNKLVLNDAGEAALAAKKCIASSTDQLKSLGVKAKGCSSSEVVAVQSCIDNNDTGEFCDVIRDLEVKATASADQ